jgi:predicted 2-oxoglutarate/Fe(II)-dependent dioxygenase YbiX
MARWLQWVSRTMSNDSRAHMLLSLDLLIQDAERFMCGNAEIIRERVSSAVEGIHNLQRTYVSDIATSSQLDFLATRLQRLE